ncbi:MAG: hypothetical protein VYD64_08285 [Pseudomonadota bacterium]|nr:hypothetical protein [Pseudomonadota bacterium]
MSIRTKSIKTKLIRANTGTLRMTGTGIVALACALSLSACIGGTTYGTGVSQEKQTFDDVYNMFTLKKKRRNIDYSARPDLIVPENTAALPEPIDVEAATSNPDWPETPEQRVARIRAQAGEIDERSGDYDIRENLRSKDGINIETRNPTGKFIAGRTDRDGNPLLNVETANDSAAEEVRKAKAELDYSRGVRRKYLTEPPTDYRVPAGTAPSGSEAFTEEELARRAAEEERRQRGYTELKPLAPRED